MGKGTIWVVGRRTHPCPRLQHHSQVYILSFKVSPKLCPMVALSVGHLCWVSGCFQQLGDLKLHLWRHFWLLPLLTNQTLSRHIASPWEFIPRSLFSVQPFVSHFSTSLSTSQLLHIEGYLHGNGPSLSTVKSIHLALASSIGWCSINMHLVNEVRPTF